MDDGPIGEQSSFNPVAFAVSIPFDDDSRHGVRAVALAHEFAGLDAEFIYGHGRLWTRLLQQGQLRLRQRVVRHAGRRPQRRRDDVQSGFVGEGGSQREEDAQERVYVCGRELSYGMEGRRDQTRTHPDLSDERRGIREFWQQHWDYGFERIDAHPHGAGVGDVGEQGRQLRLGVLRQGQAGLAVLCIFDDDGQQQQHAFYWSQDVSSRLRVLVHGELQQLVVLRQQPHQRRRGDAASFADVGLVCRRACVLRNGRR